MYQHFEDANVPRLLTVGSKLIHTNSTYNHSNFPIRMSLKVAAEPNNMSFGDFNSHSYASPPFQRSPTPFTHSPLTPRRNPNPNEQTHATLSPPQPLPSLLKFVEVKRKHKPNPLMMSKDDIREKRRNIFLNKLKDAREESRLQARGGEDEVRLYHLCLTCSLPR